MVHFFFLAFYDQRWCSRNIQVKVDFILRSTFKKNNKGWPEQQQAHNNCNKSKILLHGVTRMNRCKPAEAEGTTSRCSQTPKTHGVPGNLGLTEQGGFPPVSIPHLNVVIPTQTAFVQIHGGEVQNDLEKWKRRGLMRLDVWIFAFYWWGELQYKREGRSKL